VHSLRLRLIGLALSVLTCQVAALAAAPALFYRAGAAGAAAGSAMLCECKEEPGAECPMHKGKTQTAGNESGTLRSCAGGGDQAAAILTMLTGGGGILETALPSTRPATNGVALAPLTTSILSFDRPPTSPPPRS
jgi:hypothetical protein